jgi:hypothetical protein
LLSEAEVKRAIGGAIEAAGKDAVEGEAVAAWAVARRRGDAEREGTSP